MIWRSSYHRRIAQIADFLTAIVGFFISYNIAILLYDFYPSYFPPKLAIKQSYFFTIVLMSLLYVFLFKNQNAYSYQRFTSLIKEYTIVIKVTLSGFIATITSVFLLGQKEVPRTILITYFIVSLFLYLMEKTLLFYIASEMRKRGKNRKRVILIGTGMRTRKLITVVNRNFGWGLDIVGLLTVDFLEIGKEIDGIKVIDHCDNFQNILKIVNPEEIIITISSKKFDQIAKILEICEREGVVARLNSDFFGHFAKNVTLDNVFDLNIISFNTTKQKEWEVYIKRLIDIIGSIVAILFFLPFMLIAIVGIFISDGKPVFYSFIGYGLNKKPIKIIKLRTMVKNASQIRKQFEDQNEMIGPVFKIKNDPRVIPIGRILRKFSIDETPQLFCVLKGDMSLVGPRQAMSDELDKYESWQRRRLSIKPGLTCLWQVNGRSEIADFNEWTKLDLEYIDNWSIWLDLKILMKTIPVILFGKGI